MKQRMEITLKIHMLPPSNSGTGVNKSDSYAEKSNSVPGL
jgi:hypothetical protein